MVRFALIPAALALLAGCGSPAAATAPDGCSEEGPRSRFVSCVPSFEPGDAAGFGQERFPEIVFGPPLGGGTSAGSTDVLSLGKGGTIVLSFGGGAITDGPGADFIVFENAFYIGGNPDHVFAELGEVSVSEDGTTWKVFPCDVKTMKGCAGWHPVSSNPDNGISPFDGSKAGGDDFDLAEIGVKTARFVRVRDVSNAGGGDTAGFDLDAIAIVNPLP